MAYDREQTNQHLYRLMHNDIEVAVFLIGGIKLVGRIASVDDDSIIFESDQLIMRNAISTVQPAR